MQKCGAAPRLLALACVIAWCAPGQEIHLKTRTIATVQPTEEQSGPRGGGKADVPEVRTTRGNTQTLHQIVQFDHPPGVEDLDALLLAGARITGALPDNAVVVSAAGGLSERPDGVVWTGQFEARDKISPLLKANPTVIHALQEEAPVIVEFHSDVETESQDNLAALLGVTLLRPPEMLPQHAIVRADSNLLKALSEQDEVAYLFPADPELLTETTIYPCAGMLTATGAIAQYANVTHGWDLGADNIAHLTYYFGSLTPKVATSEAESEILRAFSQWSNSVNVTFQPSSVASAMRSVYIEFASGAHGDAYPFDGAGGMLAHTFYPVPVNAETIAGDMHFDADEAWRVGGDIDLYTVALHEAGHAIGLSHSDNPGDVMYPYYRRGVALSANDIGAAKELYRAPVVQPVPVTPTPSPVIPTPVLPSPVAPTTPTPLTLTVDTVPATTQAATVNVTGTVTGGSGPDSLHWQTNHGYTGTAIPSTSGAWTAANIPLATGTNAVTLTAFDSSDQTATRSATITMRQAVAKSCPIAVAITSPLSAVVTVNATTISVSGTASGGAGITQVSWQTSNGATGVASGVGPWLATGIPLPAGNTTIVVRAYDATGASAWVALVAVRP